MGAIPVPQGDNLPKLTERQRLFADAYILLNNGKMAAIEAGYSVRSAESLSSRLLRNDKVVAYIAARRPAHIRTLEEKFEVTEQFITETLLTVIRKGLQEKPVMDGRDRPTGEYVFDGKSVNRAAELLGKQIGMFQNKKKDDLDGFNLVINLAQLEPKVIENTTAPSKTEPYSLPVINLEP